MIKGCQRRIIMVRDTGSACFDAAYFVLKRDVPTSTSEADMLTEANRVIDSCSLAGFLSDDTPSPRKTRKASITRALLPLSVAAGLGLLAGAIGAMVCCLA